MIFVVSMPYGPGTTAVFINGMLMERSLDDGWHETDPDAGIVTLKEAPRGTGNGPDVIQIFFIDRSPPLPEAACVKIRGIVRLGMGKRGMRGVLSPALPMHGHIQPQQALHGHCDQRRDLRGSVTSPKRMRATIRECV
jgi:hypothetical protein